jgi:hypothetical protein
LVGGIGLFAAHEQGLLADPARCEQVALLLNEPEGLRRAQLRLLEDDCPPSLEAPERTTPSITDDTSIGLTRWARNEQQWPHLLQELRPWLPAILEECHLSPDEADDLHDWVRRKLPEMREGRHRSFLPALLAWLNEYGARSPNREHYVQPSPGSLRRAVEATAVRMVFAAANEGETVAMKTFRRIGRDQALRTALEVLSLAPPELELDEDLRIFRRNLYSQMDAMVREGQRTLELVEA